MKSDVAFFFFKYIFLFPRLKLRLGRRELAGMLTGCRPCCSSWQSCESAEGLTGIAPARNPPPKTTIYGYLAIIITVYVYKTRC